MLFSSSQSITRRYFIFGNLLDALTNHCLQILLINWVLFTSVHFCLAAFCCLMIVLSLKWLQLLLISDTPPIKKKLNFFWRNCFYCLATFYLMRWNQNEFSLIAANLFTLICAINVIIIHCKELFYFSTLSFSICRMNIKNKISSSIFV